MFRRFLDATDYWFGYSDDSSAGSYDLARECFVVLANDQTNAANTAEVGDGEVPPPRPGNLTATGCRAKRSSPLTREPEIAHTSNRIRPFSLASVPAGRS
jgi:hypothetical protein